MMWKLNERDDGNVELQIHGADGEIEQILIRIPPQAPRQEMIDAALRSIAHDRQLRVKQVLRHARLEANIAQVRFEATLQQARLRVLMDALRSGSARDERTTPPALAELFISFLAPKNSAQALLGDLQEMFQKNVNCYGEKQARRAYWIEVARSFGPLLWQWLKRVGFLTVLIDYFRSKFGV